MFKITPDRLQQLQEEAKKRNTYSYHLEILRRRNKKIAALEAKQEKERRRLAREARKQAKIDQESSLDRYIPKPIDWEKVQKYLDQVPLP